MKKILSLLLFILIAFGGFYLGWINLKIPAGYAGVLFSKTSGIEEGSYGNQQFIWRWQNIFPTNMKVLLYPLSPLAKDYQFEAPMPSGDVYSNLIIEQPDFTYRIHFTLNLSPQRDYLHLIPERGILPEDYETFFSSEADLTAQEIYTLFLKDHQNNTLNYNISSAVERVTRQIEQYLANQAPYLELKGLVFTKLNLPDPLLYESAKKRYLALMETRSLEEQRKVPQIVEEEQQLQQRLKELEEISSLLEENEGLLDFLALPQDSMAGHYFTPKNSAPSQ